MPRVAGGSAYGGNGEQNDKSSMYTVVTPLARKKARSSKNVNITASNRDEYDVLGRKK
jgi:hypothetical protein